MIKEKKYNLWTLATTLVIAGIIYFIDIFSNIPAPRYNYPHGVMAPEYIYVILLGFFISVMLLLVFNGKIFISWFKYIAWWAFPIAWWLVPGGTDSFLFNEMSVAGILMTILFIITLIYALVATLIQKKKEKENS